ncbi:MAG: tripartite tricarboxylate transporter substrate-binding protein [Acetobacteraceae bacterium]|nr:tripartite tricarboxylate transporter substrate-binding protein [Acetobacteraceae bacterium]
MTNITRRAALGAAAGLALSAGGAAAQAWPSRAVRIVVPLVPGGTTDAIARVIADPLSRLIGQPVVVENRAGANGWIANEYVARQPADGHTLIVNNVSTHGINSAFAAGRPVNPSRDLAPVTNLVEVPQLIVVPGTSPARTLAEFVELARRAPRPLVYASAGVGSYQHMDMEVLAARAGIQLVHLPLRGAGEMVPAVLRDDAQIGEFNLVAALPHVREGRLRALAAVGRERLPQLPEVPTTVESGFPEITTTLWNGLFAPAATPEPIVAALHRHVTAILRDPEIVAGQARIGVRVTPSESPAAFAEYVARDVARWSAIVREFNITLS